MAGWKIDRDYLTKKGDEFYRVGKGDGELVGKTYRFRLKDDDGNACYGGVYDAGAVIDEVPGTDTELLYDALGWGMYDAGCTILEVKAADWLALVWGGTVPANVAKWFAGVTKDGWYAPYG